MAHVLFIRKQLKLFIRIILLPLLLVYLLFILTNFLSANNGKSTDSLSGEKNLKYLESLQELSKRGKANVHRWHKVCGSTIAHLRRYILFPKHAKLRTSITALQTSSNLPDFGQRIFGYIHPPLNGVYQFMVSSDNCSELWLSRDSSPNNSRLVCQVDGKKNGKIVKGYTRRGEYGKYENQSSTNISLIAGHKYFFEVLHKQESDAASHVQVAWKMPGSNGPVVITGEFLSLFTKEADTQPTRGDHAGLRDIILAQHEQARVEYRQSVHYRNYMRYANTTGLELLRQTHKTLPACRLPTRIPPPAVKRYRGIGHTGIPKIYPDATKNVLQVCEDAPYRFQCSGNPQLAWKDARDIAMKYLRSSRSGNYILKNIIKVEKLVLPLEKKTGICRYFMELVVQDKVNGSSSLIADQVLLNAKGQFCNYVQNFWNPDIPIYATVMVKNQGIWVRHFIDNMVDIQQQTRDENLHTIIVDFESKDIDIENYLKTIHAKNFTVIHKKGKFFKTLAINEAVNSVKDNNSIVLQLDLHLDIPINLMRTVRKRTIQGEMAFVPQLVRLTCGSSPEFPRGYWEDFGYGLFAIYKSDWIRFGGMNVREFTHRWGGEDSEMIDRVISHGIAVQRLKIPGLFHYFHSKKGMWDQAV